MTTVISRLQQDTPKFFRVLRNIGLCLVAAGAAIVAAPIELPSVLISIANYLMVAGSVAGAVSQATVLNEEG